MPISSFPGSPFYDETTGYPNFPGWQDDPMTVPYTYGEQNKGAAWTKRLSQMGYGGLDAKSQWADALQGKFLSGYGATNLNAPGYYWQEYLKNELTPEKLDELYKQSSPTARGEATQSWAPNSRWLRRP